MTWVNNEAAQNTLPASTYTPKTPGTNTGANAQVQTITVAIPTTDVRREKVFNPAVQQNGVYNHPQYVARNDTQVSPSHTQARKRVHRVGQLQYLYSDGAGTNFAQAPYATAVSRDRTLLPPVRQGTWHGAYAAGTYYPVGALVSDGGAIFSCSTAYYGGATRAANAGNWAAFTGLPAWAATTLYARNAEVQNGGLTYRARRRHTSGATFDASLWMEGVHNNRPANSVT